MKLLLGLLCFSAGIALAEPPALTSPALWKPANVPFSFKYDDQDSKTFLAKWKSSSSESNGLQQCVYTDPVSHLRVTAEVRTFPDFPGAVDWVLKFKNLGKHSTPIIENILPLDWSIPAFAGECSLRHPKGSNAAADDFAPMEEHFGAGGKDHLESANGRSSDTTTMPFFNLQTGNHGFIGAIGWTGNWKADFSEAADETSISMSAGMKATHLLLLAGEEIRTPRIVLLPWKGGTWDESQNLWRRLVLAHYTPQDGGHPVVGPLLVANGWGGDPIAGKPEYIKWLRENHIPVDMFGIDAGWYGTPEETKSDNGGNGSAWWKNRGDWFPSTFLYPHGVHELGAACKASNMDFLCWFEPETAMEGKKYAVEYPDWYLKDNHPVNPGILLANYSDPVVRKGITKMVSDFITDFQVTWYRQDFNNAPEEYWALHDTPDRVGMTEIGHITGMYAMWDELRAKHPGLHIDNCASGGRRIDIETMARSFILWRTDHGTDDHIGEQAQTTALSPWVPGTEGFEQTYTATKPWTQPGPYETPEHVYLFRLGYQMGFATMPGEAGLKNPEWVNFINTALGEYMEVQPYFYGDFYSLLPYSLESWMWTAWQWDRPEKGDGLVIVLRRADGNEAARDLVLRHLKPDALYEVEIRTGYAKGPEKEMKGSQLANLHVELPQRSSSELVFYRLKSASTPVVGVPTAVPAPSLPTVP